MDRLLRMAFEKLIRAGNLRVSTAGGSTFTFGDGTGRPVAIRFTTRAAERRVLIDPELKFGEAYMDGVVVVEQGSIADFLDVAVKNLNRIQPNAWSSVAKEIAVALTPSFSRQYPLAGASQRGPSLQYRLSHLSLVSGFRPAIFVRLFRKQQRFPRRRATRQEAAHCRQAAIAARPQGSRHRKRMGRARSRSRPKLRGFGCRHQSIPRTGEDCAATGRRGRAFLRVSHSGLSGGLGKIRSHCLRWHVRTRRQAVLRHVFPEMP